MSFMVRLFLPSSLAAPSFLTCLIQLRVILERMGLRQVINPVY